MILTISEADESKHWSQITTSFEIKNSDSWLFLLLELFWNFEFPAYDDKGAPKINLSYVKNKKKYNFQRFVNFLKDSYETEESIILKKSEKWN